MNIDWDKITEQGAKALLAALEKKSIFDRDSVENETVIKLRTFLASNVWD